jgi:biotin carboxyl carrier protein
MKVEVNGKEYDIELLGNKAKIDGKEIAVRMDQDEITIPGESNNKFHLDFILQEGDESFVIINGMAYNVSKSLSSAAATPLKELKAPISGQIIDVSAIPGKQVKRGELVIILEAMKMENQIRSLIKGRIKEIRVKKGQSVKSGDVLLIFE